MLGTYQYHLSRFEGGAESPYKLFPSILSINRKWADFLQPLAGICHLHRVRTIYLTFYYKFDRKRFYDVRRYWRPTGFTNAVPTKAEHHRIVRVSKTYRLCRSPAEEIKRAGKYRTVYI